MGVRPNARMLRDMAARQAVQSNELLRRAYKYIARNTTLPSRVRHMAQLELNAFPNKSRPAVVKERCVETGRGRGIFTEFGLCRYQFRRKAIAGDIAGVEKASW
ncbi:Similar to S.cerevisiae protein MRP2 (Mitochondrial ribosomal protein of the small subunit) [Malassezia sympodialis ATCC 42132]|uniref:Similar to S.cerevisiae protein MRP2 (Mitochondrial ribosomal protein of the small subunit) n=2 Tax=Malassezia sympodialis (strain ATCC 42132) TaxID=1230383 RepID=A0A1M8AAG6_MALS4|nr:Similar to S.cerevisiae protein MRP2 (Mitochondrial ribosomal protein of the small subunit) [Malassezia sympodialis ATCC 42132]